MITKMKKATLVLYTPLRDKTLSKIREIGVVHLKDIEGQGEAYTTAVSNYLEVSKALEVIEKYLGDEEVTPVVSNITCGIQKAKYINKCYSQICELKDKVSQLEASIKEIEFWGDFSVKDIKALQDQKLNITIYNVPKKAVKKIPKALSYYEVARKKDRVGIALVSYNSLLEASDDYSKNMETIQLFIIADN